MASESKADCFAINGWERTASEQEGITEKASNQKESKRPDLGWAMRDCNTRELSWKA